MGNFEIQDPPIFQTEITKWSRETDADGDEMGRDMEKVFNNTMYNKAMIERERHVTEVLLTAAGWTGDAAPYSQTVNVPGATADTEAMLISALADGASEETQKAYMKAFGMISNGTASLADGQAVFKVYKKPATDIIVGLKGV